MSEDERGWCDRDGRRVLLVEGKTDCHVILALANHFDLPETFGIFACDGYESALKRFESTILRADQEVVGLLLDANSDLASRWSEVCSRLDRHPYEPPKSPAADGLVLESTDAALPRLGIWLMPNNQDPGMLEDFCLDMVDADHQNVAEEAVVLAEGRAVANFKAAHRSKAVVHTYLAWQNEPGKPLGQSITAQALRPDQPLAERFVGWLGRLFD